ncbi:polysaccharide deacetylase family sporulation protein PdaB [Bacillus carboniphilus]|uniref:Polysaccharide deacetylase family sporulation protein PdaB n=1 Tax=Bacillus carboniphilus TaxID=86663 RepID=A0ABN0W2Y1_9BACI
MGFIYVLNGKRLKNSMFIILTALFTAWFLFVQNFVHIPVFSTDKGPKAFYRGDDGVVLSFNIGWGDEKAAPIIETLEKLEVKSAVFFLSGSWAERHPDLVDKIKKRGYEIGVLGYEYKDYSELEDEQIRRDLNKALEVFKKLGIKDVEYARAPTGHFDERFLKIAERNSLHVIHWSLDSKDWTNPGKEMIVENVASAKKGDIILLHASDSAKQTAVALPLILKTLKDKGLEMVPLSKMVSDASSKTSEIN